MKQMIVLTSTIILGIYIFNLIAGNGDDSIIKSMEEMWQQGLAQRSYLGR